MRAAYERALRHRPIATKTVVGGTLALAADNVVQYNQGEAYDPKRTVALVSLATWWNGPFNHFFLNTLEHLLPQASGGWRALAGKVAITQGFVNPCIYLPLFFTWTGTARGHSIDHIADHAQRELWTTLSATWCVWTPVNLLNYSFTPIRHQASVNATASFVFNVILSVVQSRSKSPAAAGSATKSVPDCSRKSEERGQT